MNSTAFLVVFLAVLPVFGLAAWVWLDVICADAELLSFSSIDHQKEFS